MQKRLKKKNNNNNNNKNSKFSKDETILKILTQAEHFEPSEAFAKATAFV